MPVLGKLIGLLLALQLVAVALVSYTSSMEFTVTGVSIYAVCAVLLARYIDSHTEWRDAAGVYALILLCTGVGAMVGALVSRTLYSTLVALSMVLIVTAYAIALIKVVSR